MALPELAGAVATAVTAEANARGLTLQSHAEPATVRGDRELLERLVGNLVENAVRHNVDGGWVRVSTGTERGVVRLVVASSGGPVTPDDVAGLFEPFRRLGTARTGGRGAGLGLSIVRSVARAHGGRAWAEPVPGGGLQVTVELPAAPA